MARPQSSVMPAAQKVTPRNTERSLLRISQSHASVTASASTSTVQENCGRWPGSSLEKRSAILGGTPVIIANHPSHMTAPRNPALITPNHASALAAPRRRLGTPAPASSESGRSEEHTSELQSPCNLVCRLLLE